MADFESQVVKVGVVVLTDQPVADLEAPVRDRLGTGGEGRVVQDHLVLGDLLDRLRFKVVRRFRVAARVVEHTGFRVEVIGELFRAQARGPLVEDHVAERRDVLGRRHVTDEVRLQTGVAVLDVDVLLEDKLVLADDRPGARGDLE